MYFVKKMISLFLLISMGSASIMCSQRRVFTKVTTVPATNTFQKNRYRQFFDRRFFRLLVQTGILADIIYDNEYHRPQQTNTTDQELPAIYITGEEYDLDTKQNNLKTQQTDNRNLAQINLRDEDTK